MSQQHTEEKRHHRTGSSVGSSGGGGEIKEIKAKPTTMSHHTTTHTTTTGSSAHSTTSSPAKAATAATYTRTGSPTKHHHHRAIERLVLVSGSTGDIGRAIALGAAKQPNVTLLLPVRDPKKGAVLVEELKAESQNEHIHMFEVDLGSRGSIIALADTIFNKYARLDVLINNAATAPDKREMSPGGSDREDGFPIETEFAVNVQAYWLMMNRFRPLLERAIPRGSGRIVNVASNYAGDLDLSDPQFIKRAYDSNSAYRASAQARRMISWQAAQLYAKDRISVNSCHPGVVASKLSHDVGVKHHSYQLPDEAAATPLYLAFSPMVEGETGKFYDHCKEKEDEFVREPEKVEQLWNYCKGLALVDDIPPTGGSTSTIPYT